jgi:hypothetical protein
MNTFEAKSGVLDWRQLRAEVSNRLAKAPPTGARHWKRILDLVDERLTADPSASAPPQDGRQWWLTEVRIAGFRGIPQTLDLALDPMPGLTVLHAPNGTGKSTIADAIRAALWGTPALQMRELWQPVDRAVGADRAHVEVRLHSGPDELRCAWTDDPGPSATASLVSPDAEYTVSVTDPDWQAALSAYTPVFSYADTQDRLGTSDALVKHLEELLALGPCFALLNEDVEEHAATARSTVARLQKLKAAAKAAVENVDVQFAPDSAQRLPPIGFPHRISDEGPDNWLADSGLAEDLTTTSFVLSTEDLIDTERRAQELDEAIRRLDESEAGLDNWLDERVHGHLTGLHTALDGSPPGGPCPVCGQDGDWWTSLSNTALRLTEWSTARGDVNTAARALHDLHCHRLRPLIEAATALSADPDGLAGALMDPPPDHGRSAVARARLGTVVQHILSSSFTTLVSEVRRHGDHDRRWRAARQEAVQQFVAAWRTDGPVAVTVNEWTQASKNLTVLRRDLRDARGTRLGEEVGDVLRRLLADTPLHLTGVTFTGDEPLQLADADGGSRRLGMLSAGQRNALVLAPLLRARAGGPFGFLIVDDPVHAFDDMRIDLVSDELIRLYADRRVVVLTHDSRLNDTLVAKKPDTDVRTLIRDGNGSMTTQGRKAPWVSLVEEATGLLNLPGIPADLGRMPVLVRGMCRHAVDGALRNLALRWAVLAKEDLNATAEALDKCGGTHARFTHALRYKLPDHASVADVARAQCAEYLQRWNDASHDTGGTSKHGLTEEVAAARRACELLDAWGRE